VSIIGGGKKASKRKKGSTCGDTTKGAAIEVEES